MKSRPMPRPPLDNPLAVLPKRRLAGLIPTLIVCGVTAVATGVGLQMGFAGSLGGIWVAAIIIVFLFTVAGLRAFQRQGVLDPAIESILPMLGAQRPARELVRARGWTSYWVGYPRRISVRYAAHVNDADDRFVDQVKANVSRRIGENYSVRRHLPRKCLVELELAPLTKVPREEQRAEQVAKLILGDKAKVDVTLVDGAVTRVEVRHDQGVRMSFPQRRAHAEKVFTSMLPNRWRAAWDLEKDVVVFEQRPPMPENVLHEVTPTAKAMTHEAYRNLTIPIGLDEDGKEIVWRPAISPHCLTIGGTGSGKTSFEHTVLTHLTALLARVWVLDGKRIEFIGFRDWPNVELVASAVEDQVRMLHAAHDLMERRYSAIESGKQRLEDFEPLFIIIDEYATFKARVQRWYTTVKPKGAPAKAPVLELLSDLARLARSAKIHMLVGIQRPDAEIMGGEMRDNFGCRVSLGRLSPQGAMMMWDSPAVGVALPRNRPGRGIALNAESQPVEIQTYYTPDPGKLIASDVSQWTILEKLRPLSVSYPRKMILPPDPVIVDGEEVELEPDYPAWVSTRIVIYKEDLDAILDDEQDEGDDVVLPVETPAAPVPSNVIELDARRAVRFEPSEPAADDVDESHPAEGLLDAGWGEIDQTLAISLGEGDLIETDADAGVWGVVESVEPDVVDEDMVVISYRDLDSGDYGLMTVSDNEVIEYRRPDLNETGD